MRAHGPQYGQLFTILLVILGFASLIAGVYGGVHAMAVFLALRYPAHHPLAPEAGVTAIALFIPLATITFGSWAWRTSSARRLALGYAIATSAAGLVFAAFLALLGLPILVR